MHLRVPKDGVWITVPGTSARIRPWFRRLYITSELLGCSERCIKNDQNLNSSESKLWKNQRQADIVWSIVIGADRNMGWGAARLQVRNGHMLTWAFIWLPDPQAFPCPFPKKCDAIRQVWAKTRWTMINTFSMHTWCAASQAKDYVFGVIYLIEICIKICGLKCSFFKDRLAKACWSTQLPWGGRPKKAVRSIRSGRSGVFRAI